MSGEVLHSARPQGETTLAKALNDGLSDALAADDRVVLMGEDVEARRSFITRNAKDVRFLDV